MAVDRSAILAVICRFLGMGTGESRSLHLDDYVCMPEFVRRSTSLPFRRFLGDIRREFMRNAYP
jgi:hypothetical protein